jgi:hypothetical protein
LAVAVLVLTIALASGLLLAQTRLLAPNDYYILSGSDIGFRVEGTDTNGRPAGRVMLRINGRWVEAGTVEFARHATN